MGTAACAQPGHEQTEQGNKGNYDQAGRLTPDDMARERKKMMQAETAERDRVKAKGFDPGRQTTPTDPGEPASSPDRGGREESA